MSVTDILRSTFTALVSAAAKVPGIVERLPALAERLPDIVHALIGLVGAIVTLLTALLPVVPETHRPLVEAGIALLTTVGLYLASKKMQAIVAAMAVVLEKLADTADATKEPS